MPDYEEVPPRADAMIASMRAIGYDLPTAIADLLDNSIYAQARNIRVEYEWAGSESWIRITDDGLGMTEKRLRMVIPTPTFTTMTMTESRTMWI